MSTNFFLGKKGYKIFDFLRKSPLSAMFNYLSLNQLFNGMLSYPPETMMSEPFACSLCPLGDEGVHRKPKNLERQGRHFRHDRDNSAGGRVGTRREQVP